MYNVASIFIFSIDGQYRTSCDCVTYPSSLSETLIDMAMQRWIAAPYDRRAQPLNSRLDIYAAAREQDKTKPDVVLLDLTGQDVNIRQRFEDKCRI